MESKRLLPLFPPRLRKALSSLEDKSGICEIRLRSNRPLSLTHYGGNLFLDENGKITSEKNALRATEEEIRAFVCAFCDGNVYRYFENLKEGFLIDEEGYRLGLCPEKGSAFHHVPERFDGINLRIPRFVPQAADDLLGFFQSTPLASTLILSPPGGGKTTLLRALALTLSRENPLTKPLRVAVIDERKELFPQAFSEKMGLCDVLSGYEKSEGIELAIRLFSPQVICCDEIGNDSDARAILNSAHSGTLFFATTHGKSFDEIKKRPSIKSLLDANLFSYLALLEKKNASQYQSHLNVVKLP